MNQNKIEIETPKELDENARQAYLQFHEALDKESWTDARSTIEGQLSDRSSSEDSPSEDVFAEGHFINYCMDSATISAGTIMQNGDGKKFLGLINEFAQLSPDLQPFIKLSPQSARSDDSSPNRQQFWTVIESEFLGLLDNDALDGLKNVWQSVVATGLVNSSYINELPQLKSRLLAKYDNAVKSGDPAVTQELADILNQLGLKLPSQDNPEPPSAPVAST